MQNIQETQPSRVNILVIDDEPVILNSVKSIIEGANYTFTGAASGKAALRYLESYSLPDLCLVDVEMPVMNGYEVITRIKDNIKTAHIPVIFLTAKNDGESELEGLSLGAVDYITKPFSPQLLLKRIEIHLLMESQKQELLSQKQELMAQKQELINFNKNLHEMVNERTKTVVELKNAIIKVMSELVDFRDGVTGKHIERTQRYLRVLIEEIIRQGLYEHETSEWDMELVLHSSQLHDVGKIAIQDSILQKPGKLTNEEFEIIKSHTSFGEGVINKIKENTTEQAFLEYARILAGTHHEKWDGSGYHNKLKGDEIPLLGRIMAIADVYDALVSERPYKNAITHEEAVDIILKGRGTHFEPMLVDLFYSVSEEFRNVSLSNG